MIIINGKEYSTNRDNEIITHLVKEDLLYEYEKGKFIWTKKNMIRELLFLAKVNWFRITIFDRIYFSLLAFKLQKIYNKEKRNRQIKLF